MSSLMVTLTVGNGPLVGQEYELRDAADHVLGRAAECYPPLPDEFPYKDISRRHCLLRVELPEVGLLDLGSTNGTFVNGAKIGQLAGPGPEVDPVLETIDYPAPTGWHPVRDGDVITLGGGVVLFVRIQVREEFKRLAVRRRRGEGAGQLGKNGKDKR
jgi:pSer/pThr/pTyr-binding forkhead associated (FHA) protein